MITPRDSLSGIAIVIAALAVIVLMAAIRKARHAQRAAYYVTRRHAQNTANQQLLWSIGLFLIAAGVFIVAQIMPQPLPENALTARSDMTAAVLTTVTFSTPQPSPTMNSLPKPVSASQTAPSIEGRPTDAPPSPPPLPTPIPTQTTVEESATAASSHTDTTAPPVEGKHLMLRAIAGGADASGLPINPSSEFQAGIPSIYIFFDFQNVPVGQRLRHNWFRNGGSVFFESFPWERSGSGNAFIEWAPARGFDVGLYEVRVFLEDELQFVANFEVK
ncbi:MAG: hypothetical protein RMN25_00075 [Anaerolineae bacterium]|nr:hypothetical protein [Thermoflexales bacterium]MDW8406156.1 hypothetical protein [Anaerolineae bacterium]